MLRGVFCTNVCSAFVEGGVVCIEVFRVQIVLNDPQSITEALEVRDFPRAQEADRVANIGVVGKAQDVVIGQPRLLLWYDLALITFTAPFQGLFLKIPMNFYGRIFLSLDSLTDGYMINEDLYHLSGQMRYMGVLLHQLSAVIANQHLFLNFGNFLFASNY